MNNIRRWYFYIASAISLQIVTWAIIALLRNPTAITVAFQAAVIIVALPLFLLHWRWATRSENDQDRFADDYLRVLYLFSMIAAFLMPIIFNAKTFLSALLRSLFSIEPLRPYWLSNNEMMINSAIAIVVLGVLGLYHTRLLRKENLLAGQGMPATIRRAFVYLFTLVGLILFAFGLGAILRWLRVELGAATIDPTFYTLTQGAAQLLIGLLVWLPFWRYAQMLFNSGSEEERESALRKTYLYFIVFISTITVVSDLTIIGATLLRRLLDLEPPEDTGLVLSSLIVAALIWIYHVFVLHEDSRAAPAVEAQANIRRVYWYLVAAVGLMAFLFGLGGDISVAINALNQQRFITELLRNQLAWFSAVLIAGMMVWVLPWRRIQLELELPAPQGLHARSANARRYYLFGFILLATLTFLSCAIFLVYTILTRILGVSDSGINFSEVAQAIAYGLMAVGVWLYHGSLLRRDREVIKEAMPGSDEAPLIAVLDDEDGRMGARIRDALASALPTAKLSTVGLTAAARASINNDSEQLQTVQILDAADIIVGPWTVTTPYVGEKLEDDGAIAAVAASSAQKLLIPKSDEHWNWAGVGGWQEDTTIHQVVQAAMQIAAGEPVRMKRPIGIGRIILMVIGAFFLILFLLSLIGIYLSGFLF